MKASFILVSRIVPDYYCSSSTDRPLELLVLIAAPSAMGHPEI